jgi:GH15 family glucan-1,4-alpha-glucosidase
VPRDLPIGNGNLLINFDANYTIRDIYFPYVGQENHTLGDPCRTGLWVDGDFLFFNFCAETITEDGYLLHKYTPDGSFGSNWHPWVAKRRQRN